MLLTVDVGNTNIVQGIFEGDTLLVSWRLLTLHDRTADELWVLTSQLLSSSGIEPHQINGVVLSSVVPSLTQTMTEMMSRRFGKEVFHVNADNSGLLICLETPDEIGADRLVNSVAALALYGKSNRSLIVVDFGTATTFDVVSASGEYLGGVICPGAEISADALFQRAARLPRVDVKKPDGLIGRTTESSMQSGLFFGHIAMVEGIVQRFERDLKDDTQVVCIATGGLASSIASETTVIDHVNPDLTLTGLKLIWERNKKAGSKQ